MESLILASIIALFVIGIIGVHESFADVSNPVRSESSLSNIPKLGEFANFTSTDTILFQPHGLNFTSFIIPEGFELINSNGFVLEEESSKNIGKLVYVKERPPTSSTDDFPIIFSSTIMIKAVKVGNWTLFGGIAHAPTYIVIGENKSFLSDYFTSSPTLNQNPLSEPPPKPTPVLSPKQQLDSGIAPEYVICKEGLELIVKPDAVSSACVTPETKTKLNYRWYALVPALYGNPFYIPPEPAPTLESKIMKKAEDLGITNIMKAVDSQELSYDEKKDYIKIRYEESPNQIPSLNIRIKDFTRNLEYGDRPTFIVIETGYANPCTSPKLEVYHLKQEIGNDHTSDDLVYEDRIVYSCPFFDSFYPVLKFWDETDFDPFPVCEKEGRYLVVGDSGYERMPLEEYYCRVENEN